MGNVAGIVFSLNPFQLSCFKAFQARFPWVQWAQWAAGFFWIKTTVNGTVSPPPEKQDEAHEPECSHVC